MIEIEIIGFMLKLEFKIWRLKFYFFEKSKISPSTFIQKALLYRKYANKIHD